MVHTPNSDPACVAFWLSLMLLINAVTAINMETTAPFVDLGYARYQGSFDAQTNISSFLGIRYAAPPIGKLRFQVPQAPTSESDVQRAIENPKMCYQVGFGLNTTALAGPPDPGNQAPIPESDAQSVMQNHDDEYQTEKTAPVSHNQPPIMTPDASEDCLFLNVFVPGTMSTESVSSGGLPVLVWIHGGGYHAGCAAQYNGADLVTDSLNTLVVVVIQYRLGAFGFLSGNEMKEKGVLNAGLLDQTFALKWVQDHIGLFGGDKRHVTIWGESAGAGSVLQHIVANGGNTQPPLFNAAITSSAYLPPQYYYNDHIPESLYDAVVSVTGCASSDDTFTCLQSVETQALQNANIEVSRAALYGAFAFVPVVDGTFILERPTITLAKGRVNGEMVLAVTNQNEGNLFVFEHMSLTITEYISLLFPDMTSSSIQEAALVYEGYGTVYEQAVTIMGDAIFVCPTYYLLGAFPGRSWKGLYAILPAFHTQDMKYYFPSYENLFTPPRINNTQFTKIFVESFMSFANHYDVNVKLDPTSVTPKWSTYDVGDLEMVFNLTETNDAVVSSNRTDGSLLHYMSVVGNTEMLFDPAEAGEPVVLPVKTDGKLQQRCAFWSKVTAETAQ